MKKLLAMVLALVMTLSLAVSASAFKDDKDVSADYAEAVAVLNGMDVFKGYEDGSFKPQGNITRAEVATIIYRIYTGDVAKNDKSGLYSTYNKFSDMTGAGWAAGYIGYCANAELVKGYPDGTFKPSGNVTGYEVLAMILRAVGYDKNGEFSGADWSLNVAKYAEQLGVLKNVAKTTNLGAPATRELVAEILFRAIQQPMVTYTPAFGYVTDKVQKLDQTSLGYKNFKLVSGDGTDDWGRPTTVWAKDANDNAKYDAKDTTEYATVVATADATFNVETSQCDICEALGVKKTTTVVDTYTNGKLDTKDVTYTATATKAMVGAQGQQLEYYKVDGGYRLVVIDTYLAKVDTVKAEKTDAKGHVTSDAYMALTVYTTSAGKTMYVKGDDYAKDDYVLVNVNEESANDVSIVGFTNKQALVEIVGKAESFDGAQTKIWKNADKHTVADKDYMDAVQFNHNEAKESKIKFTWFLDQFGNLIGSVALDRSNYAVLKEIVWNVGRPGSAEATLISMVDGKEYKATVDKFDGFDLVHNSDWLNSNADADNMKPYHTSSRRDIFGYVGEDSTDNEAYLGLAMYRVDTNDDGTVQLQGFDYASNTEYVSYDTNVSVNVKASAILRTTVSGLTSTTSEVASLSEDTNFVIRTVNDDDEYVYTLYTGTSELPAMQNKSVDLFWVDSDDDGYADFVYVTDYVADTLANSYVFATNSQGSHDLKTDNWTMKVYVNGAEKEIEFDDASYNLISENLGKLYIAEFDTTSGAVTKLHLVNEAKDADAATVVKNTTVDYVTGTLVAANGRLQNTENVQMTYNTKSATLVNYDTDYNTLAELAAASSDDLAKIGVWVVADPTDDSYTQAVTVYVGTKLGKGVDLAVTAKDGSLTKEGTTFTYAPAKENLTKDVLTFTANDNHSVLVYDGGKAMHKATVTTTNADHSWTVTVYSEDGTAHEQYTVNMGWEYKSDDASLKSASISAEGSNKTSLDVKDINSKGNTDLDTAATTPKHLNVTAGEKYRVDVEATHANAKVEVVSAENLDAAKAALPATASSTATNEGFAQVDGNTALNGGIVVVRVTAESGAVMYYVFSAK